MGAQVSWQERRTGQDRGRRRGEVFPLRLTTANRQRYTAATLATAGPKGLGPWLLWAVDHALRGERLPRAAPPREALPHPNGPDHSLEEVIPVARGGNTGRKILDLCGGSGAWSEPYRRAGYDVEVITIDLQAVASGDVRLYQPPAGVWGVLAAPPCQCFSIARNANPPTPADYAAALSVVDACIRIAQVCRPKWWALENPNGTLGRWLGTPTYVFEPFQFGDPWTKITSLWGDFELPSTGPYVEPNGSAMDRGTAAKRAITPPGFAQAFFEANP